MTTETTKTLPPIPDVPFVHGVHSEDNLVHAVAHPDAVWAVNNNEGEDSPARARSVCGVKVTIARYWGEFRRGSDETDRHAGWGQLCPRCAWAVALANGTEKQELAAISPGELDMVALRRLVPDPLLVVKMCRSVLADRDRADAYNDDYRVHVLAAVTAHKPVVLLSEGCRGGECGCGCDNDLCEEEHDERACYAESASVACWACSIVAGPWAGEWAGVTVECAVAAPCSALLAMAEKYGQVSA